MLVDVCRAAALGVRLDMPRSQASLGSVVHRVIARDLELGQLEGLGIIEYYGVGCSGGLPPLVIFPSRRRMLVSYWSIVFKNSIN